MESVCISPGKNASLYDKLVAIPGVGATEAEERVGDKKEKTFTTS